MDIRCHLKETGVLYLEFLPRIKNKLTETSNSTRSMKTVSNHLKATAVALDKHIFTQILIFLIFSLIMRENLVRLMQELSWENSLLLQKDSLNTKEPLNILSIPSSLLISQSTCKSALNMDSYSASVKVDSSQSWSSPPAL